MLKLSEIRSMDVRQADGSWRPVLHLGQVEAGDVFRLFEGDGSPVIVNGKAAFRALGPTSIACEPAD